MVWFTWAGPAFHLYCSLYILVICCLCNITTRLFCAVCNVEVYSSYEMLLQLRRYLFSFHKGRVDCISYLGDKKRTLWAASPLSELSLKNFQVTSLKKKKKGVKKAERF